MIAALMAPIEMPLTHSGWMPDRLSRFKRSPWPIDRGD